MISASKLSAHFFILFEIVDMKVNILKFVSGRVF